MSAVDVHALVTGHEGALREELSTITAPTQPDIITAALIQHPEHP